MKIVDENNSLLKLIAERMQTNPSEFEIDTLVEFIKDKTLGPKYRCKICNNIIIKQDPKKVIVLPVKLRDREMSYAEYHLCLNCTKNILNAINLIC